MTVSVVAIVVSASVCTLYIGFDFCRVIMECPFVAVVRRPLLKHLCEYMPHSVHPTCKLLNFLRMRVTCRSVVQAVTSQLPRRIVVLLRHALREVRDANETIRDSGFMWQLLFCGGKRQRDRLPRPLNGLVIDPDTGIPKGMTIRYWDERQRKKLITGWVRDSDNVWRLHL